MPVRKCFGSFLLVTQPVIPKTISPSIIKSIMTSFKNVSCISNAKKIQRVYEDRGRSPVIIGQGKKMVAKSNPKDYIFLVIPCPVFESAAVLISILKSHLFPIFRRWFMKNKWNRHLRFRR